MEPDPHLGRTVGNVRLVAPLGQGAMGVVYRGYHERMAKEVAVKLLIANDDAEGHYHERFLREGRSAAKVRHDHVVQVIDAGQQGKLSYLVMELVNGPSLGTLLDQRGALPPDLVAKLAVGICSGLAAIHASGVLHRDIKPDNILVDEHMQPKITDLGLAKTLDSSQTSRLTATGIVIGTPLYVSPESIRDPKSLTTAADIYGLGATLYHLLCGQPPFPGKNAFEVMRGHLEKPPQPLRELRPEIPPGLAALVERCLDKSPSGRPTAVELADLFAHGTEARAHRGDSLVWLVIIGTVLVAGLAVGAWVMLRGH